MSTHEIQEQIVANAERVRELHGRIHRTLQHRDESPEKREEWKEACREFHANYDRLAFPGGYWNNADANALQRIAAGDKRAIETAICFLEVRPYFFRSGYMFKDLLRKTKKAPLSEDQDARLKIVLTRLEEWRGRKRDGPSIQASFGKAV